MTLRRALLCLAALPVAAAHGAPAGGDADQLGAPAYLDDRSTPDALLRSLYNAINRHEYARAWSYFSAPPVKNFDKYAAGFAGTVHVDVATGRAIADGAAGSIFYQVPVAIRSVDKAGEEKTFTGCYTLRQLNPQLQEPPYRPLAIEKGALKVADDAYSLTGALPESCEGITAPEETPDELKARVTALFTEAHRADCNLTEVQRPFLSGEQPEMFELRFRYDSDDVGSERTAHLFRFACALYAYNTSEVYYVADDYNAVTEASFAEPDLDIRYEDEEHAKVKSMTIAGFNSASLLVNSEYDPASKTITSFSKWRGVGDAFSAGTWVFRNGRFVLTSYSVDAAYDEQEEPVEVLNYEKKD